MKKYFLILLSFFITVSCNSQKKQADDMKIDIHFYPSSGGDAIYSICLEDDSLIVKNNEPMSRSENSIYKERISDEKLRKLRDIVTSVEKRNDVESEIILDSWRIEVKINNIKFFNESDVRIKTLPKDVRNLINFLTKDSTVKIELYGFS